MSRTVVGEVKCMTLNGVSCISWRWNVLLDCNNYTFRIGSVHGMFTIGDNLELIAIANDKIGNGDFAKTMDWFESSAKYIGLRPAVVEIWNDKLRNHLINKRGYKPYPLGVIKND